MTRSFVWMNAAQFGGALNDNVFRMLVVFFLIGMKGADQASEVAAVVGAIFVVPFLLFMTTAGWLADRFSKRHITVVVKIMEITAMTLALGAFYYRNEWIAYGVVFLMSTQSALFGPTKYGIVPELVGNNRLSRANSLIVLFTYLAIIIGTALAPTVDIVLGGNYVAATYVCLGIGVLGLLAALRVEVTPAMHGERSLSPLILRDVWRTLRSIRHEGYLILSVIASAFFLLLGGYVQLNLIPFGMEMLDFSEQESGYLFLLAAVGIGFGAWAVGRLSGRAIRLGLVPVGMLGVILASLGLAFYPGHLIAVCFFIILLGISAGFFVVPLEAYVQYRSPANRRGEILAAKGFLSWSGVLLAAGLLYLFAEVLGLTPAQGFLVMGLFTLLLLLVAFYFVPTFFRLFLSTVTKRESEPE